MFISQINLNGKKKIQNFKSSQSPKHQWAMSHDTYNSQILWQDSTNNNQSRLLSILRDLFKKKKEKKKPLAECKLIHLSQSYTGGFCATCYCHTSKQAIFQIKLKKITKNLEEKKNEKGEKSCSLFNALFLLENALQVCLNSIL